jgi:uncharacterized protein
VMSCALTGMAVPVFIVLSMDSIAATGVAIFITGWLVWIWVVAMALRLATVNIQQIGIHVNRRKSQMHIHPLTLSLLPETFAVCRLETEDAVPQWALSGPFLSMTHTSEELSLVCPASRIPLETEIRADRSWRCFKLHGPIPFSLTGILNSVTVPLAQANIDIFAISTYDTDHVLVQEHNLQSAIHALREAGHTLQTDS